MRSLGKLIIVLFISFSIFAQNSVIRSANDIFQVPAGLIHKIGSAELIKFISEKEISANKIHSNATTLQNIQTAIYFDEIPSNDKLNFLNSLGIIVFEDSWTPPLLDHPYGFLFAEIPISKLIDVLSLDYVKLIDLTEQLSFPMNNEADKVLNADNVWSQGWTGAGIKVAILDSGLDTDPINVDLPSIIIKKDYSGYPILDDNVENQVTGHGTHVTGSVLGRGTLSANNIGNGGNAYKGVAPSASLVFLKIGDDYTAGATTNAIVNAMDAAINVYDVDIISMSYGSWDTYHDGSSTKDQKVDWCYSQGVPVFLAAGNEGASDRHYSSTVSGNSTTNFIKINVLGAAANSTNLFFNLVWFDGLGVSRNLSVTYYDDLFQEITNVYSYPQTESTKGTESLFSQSLFNVPAGNSTYYLKITNNSSSTQTFHIYEQTNSGKIKFDNPDPNYTIVSPATATNGFCVGAFTSRQVWTSSDSTTYTFNETLNQIASYSSRGPRVDGVQKPDIVAPGTAIISIRDRDVLTVPDLYWVDNDGNTTGEANYYVMEGTSMAAPQCAGAAALYLNKFPSAAPEDIYNALRDNAIVDIYTGSGPTSVYGYGKLDIYAAMNTSGPLPVELSTFSAIIRDNFVHLNWRTETELNNYGFEVQRSTHSIDWQTIGFVEGNGNSNSPKEYNYFDDELNPSGIYYYRLKQIDNDGSYKFSKIIDVNFDEIMNYELSQNYPNPFNPSTSINFTIQKSGNVSLKIYNVVGEEIETLFEGRKEAGIYTITYDAKGLPSGFYFYKLSAVSHSSEQSFTQTKKMILMK